MKPKYSPEEYVMRMFSENEHDDMLELQEESDFVNEVNKHNEEKRRDKNSKE